MPNQPPPGELPVTREETILRLLKKSKRRRHVPIRRTFVQQGERAEPEPGPLASFVRNRDARALDLYLLHRALATKEPFDTRAEAGAWARMVDLDVRKGVPVVSRAWARLVGMSLVARRRKGRLAVITSLREDGSGSAYTRPRGSSDTYFQLPLSYWLEGYDASLSLRAKAMLLICLTLQDWSVLPTKRVPDWYGVSSDTAERGLDELREAGLVLRRKRWRREPLVAYGFVPFNEYAVNPKFKRPRRLIVALPGAVASSKAG